MQVLRDGNNKIPGKFQVVYAQAPLDCLPQRQTHRIWKSSMLFPLMQKPNLYCLNQNNLNYKLINSNKNDKVISKIGNVCGSKCCCRSSCFDKLYKDDEVINNGNYYHLKNQEVENDDTIGTRDVYFWDPLTKEYSIKGFN